MSSKECVFCTLPEIKERTFAQNKHAVAFPTNIPIVEGHTLVCPKRCVARVEDLEDEELFGLFSLARQVKGALRKAYQPEGFNHAWNEGKLAGQSVPHLHIHILPRTEGDAGLDGYDVRSHLYRTGDREPTPEEDLRETATHIGGFL